MVKQFIQIASLMAMLAVVLGAFGAHALKAILDPGQLNTFEIGVRYQFYHSLAIGFVALLLKSYPSAWIQRAGWMFLIGIFLFSGSLYLLASREVLGIESWTWLGPLTPIGGLCFIIGWAFVFMGASKQH